MSVSESSPSQLPPQADPVAVKNRFALLMAAAFATVAIAAGLLFIRDEVVEQTTVAPAPIWIPVATNPPPLRETRSFTVARPAGTEVPAVTWSGTITAVSVNIGDLLDPATAPISINGIERPWFVAGQPPYRSVGLNMKGADVDAVAVFLEQAGLDLEHEDGDAVNDTMVNAIRQWATDQGHPPRSAAFDPAWIAWLPEQLVGSQVITVDVMAGQAAPASGAKFISVGERTVNLVPVVDNATSAPIAVDALISRVLIGDEEYPFVSNLPDEAGLMALADILPAAQTEVSLIVVSSYPATAGSVPSSALVSVHDGFCLNISATPDGANSEAIPVSVLGSSAGVAVTSNVEGFVLLNPGEHDGNLCS